MSEDNGPVCPECGTPRAADGTPACTCAQRASDAHRDTRTAEAAAAEDFDPVRIRPYVELGDPSATDPSATERTEAEAPRETREPTGPDTLSGAAGSTTSAPLAEEADRPAQNTGAEARPRRRRRTTLVVTGAGTALAVLVTGAFLGGLFSYDSPSRGGSRSDGVRAPVPEGSADAPVSPSTSSPSATSARPSASSSPSPRTTPAGDPTAPTRSATQTGPPSAPAPSATGTARPSDPAPQDPVLRFGDRGPEVTELQLRLRQIGYYDGDIDGDFDGEVENAVRGYQLTRVILADESGVYGEATRASLESETQEP